MYRVWIIRPSLSLSFQFQFRMVNPARWDPALLGLIHTVRFFSNCDCDSSYRNKWVAQDSMEVFTYATVTTLPTPTQPIMSKNKSQSQIAQCEWALRIQLVGKQLDSGSLDPASQQTSWIQKWAGYLVSWIQAGRWPTPSSPSKTRGRTSGRTSQEG